MLSRDTLQVNPLTKKEIKFSEDYRKVPIVRMGGELFKDSPVIIDELIARLRETKVMSDEEHAVFCSSDAKKWAEWADKQLAVLLFPNLTRNFSESYQVGNDKAVVACASRFSAGPPVRCNVVLQAVGGFVAVVLFSLMPGRGRNHDAQLSRAVNPPHTFWRSLVKVAPGACSDGDSEKRWMVDGGNTTVMQCTTVFKHAPKHVLKRSSASWRRAHFFPLAKRVATRVDQTQQPPTAFSACWEEAARKNERDYRPGMDLSLTVRRVPLLLSLSVRSKRHFRT